MLLVLVGLAVMVFVLWWQTNGSNRYFYDCWPSNMDETQ